MNSRIIPFKRTWSLIKFWYQGKVCAHIENEHGLYILHENLPDSYFDWKSIWYVLFIQFAYLQSHKTRRIINSCLINSIFNDVTCYIVNNQYNTTGIWILVHIIIFGIHNNLRATLVPECKQYSKFQITFCEKWNVDNFSK